MHTEHHTNTRGERERLGGPNGTTGRPTDRPSGGSCTFLVFWCSPKDGSRLLARQTEKQNKTTEKKHRNKTKKGGIKKLH